MTATPAAALRSAATGLPPEVRGLLGRTARTIAWGAALHWIVRGVLVAAVASLGWTALGTIIPVGIVSPLLVLVAGGLLALLLGIMRGLAPSSDLMPAACVADTEFRLHERLSTAVDLAAGRIPPTGLGGVLLRDAAQAARTAAAGAPLRPHAPAGIRWALAAAVAAVAAALLVPGLTIPATPARDTAVRIRREGRRLEQFSRQLEQRARAERAPQARRSAPKVRALGQRLQQQRMARSEALARIATLERELEQARRQLGQRIAETISPNTPSPPESLFRPSTALDQTIRQLRDLAARLGQMQNAAGEQQDLLEQLAGLAQAGEGQLPAEARRQIDEARRQIGRGDVGRGREAINIAMDDLQALSAMLADESALRLAERELDRSATRIGQGGTPSGDEAEPGEAQPARPAPGERRLREQEGELTGAPPPEGPNEGSQPGQGRLGEKLGPSTPRLQTPEQRTRVRGREGQGQLQTTELLGPGRRQPARLPEGTVGPAVVRRADEHMTRLRIPADLRRVVRRYFELLAGRR